jgi:hypothetical protein
MGLALKGVYNGLKFGCGEVVTLFRGYSCVLYFSFFRIAEWGRLGVIWEYFMLAGPLECAVRITW